MPTQKTLNKFMNKDNIDIAPVAGDETVVTPVTTPQPSTEELTQKLKELEGFNARLLNENKELKGSKEDKVIPAETKPNTINTPTLSVNDIPLEQVATITELLKEFSVEELEKAKGFVGTSLGKDLKEVANSVGFKAEISSARTKAHSDKMIESEGVELKPLENKQSILKSIEAGKIDINLPENAEYRKMYVLHKSEQL
jgi:hypothetical protein